MSGRQAMKGIGREVRSALKHKPAVRPQLAPSTTFVVLHERNMYEQGQSDGQWHRLPWSQFYNVIEVGGKVEVRSATASEAKAIMRDTEDYNTIARV